MGGSGGGRDPKPHLYVVQLGAISCHDEVGASVLHRLAHHHCLGCLPRRLFTEDKRRVG